MALFVIYSEDAAGVDTTQFHGKVGVDDGSWQNVT